MSAKLGEKLIQAGLINDAQLSQALEVQKKTAEKLGTILTRLKFIDEDDLAESLSEIFDVPAINLKHFEIEKDVLKLVPPDVARRYSLIPISRTGNNLTIAIADPTNIFALDDIKFMTGNHVEAVIAPDSQIKAAIEAYYGSGTSLVKMATDLEAKMFDLDRVTGELMADGGRDPMKRSRDDLTDEEREELAERGQTETTPGQTPEGVLSDEEYDELIKDASDELDLDEDEGEEGGMPDSIEVEAPIVKLVNGIFIKAVKLRVSDIHFEPYEKSYRVRYRLDGVLRKELSLPMKIRNAVTSRIKIMAQLDIAEKRLPQDGRIKMRFGNKQEIDFRVSTLPTLFGEKIVLRLLDKSNLQLDMTQLGFSDAQLASFQEAIHKPFGMVLVTGPTGSGKTTTLYSALSQLNTISENIMSAEDPVEYNLIGVNQVNMRDDIGLNFAASLRAFLRQDPDIIMVGEIRDFETAEIAVKAALTGHLVLSTIHTNDAPSTINRLLNMGIEPFLVSSSLVMVLAQRLVRKICKDCKMEIQVPPEALLDLGFGSDEINSMKVFKGRGCANCSETGYKGRLALYEVMTIGDEIRELILRGASSMEIKEAAVAMGMFTLRDSGLQKIREGMTTIEEVVRVTYGD